MGGGGTYPVGGETLGGPNIQQSPWTPIGGNVQNEPASPWTPGGAGQNNGPFWTGGAPFQQGIGPAYNRLTGGGPAALRGYQGGPNRNFNQQAGAWQFNQGFGYQGGPNRNFNQQTNKWQWNT
jgi:hypothetical protein